MRQACASGIVGGFESDALGARHSYPSQQADQINLMGSVTASLLPAAAENWNPPFSTPFWCADADGVWAYRMHTAQQIQDAGAEGKGHVVLHQTALADLLYQVEQAGDAAEIAALVWSSPT